MFVDYPYPWTRLLIPQQPARFQESTPFIFVSQETCSSTRFLEMGLHVKIHTSIVKSILTYGDETWLIKWKHGNKLLATEME
jgi:hypothetical protein